LFVFAFSIVGEDTLDELTIVPRPLVWFLIVLASFLLGWFVFPLAGSQTATEENNFAQVLWEQRSLDALAQIVLIFSGVLGLLGLLADSKRPAKLPLTVTMFRQSEKLETAQPAIIQDSGDSRQEPQAISEESLS
jgi:hypothetical protein